MRNTPDFAGRSWLVPNFRLRLLIVDMKWGKITVNMRLTRINTT